MNPIDVRGGRVAIVGAGIVGCTLAYRLAEAGAKVTLVARDAPGSVTSANSFAVLSGSGARDAADALPMWKRLMAEARELADEVGGEWLHVDGSLWWSEEGPIAHETDGTLAEMREIGYPVEVLTPAEARELEPELRIPASVGEVHLMPEEAWMDVPAACAALVGAADRRFRLRERRGDVRSILSSASRVDGIRLADGTSLSADVVINAAGPWAAELAELAGSSLAVGHAPGAMVFTAPTAVRLRHMIWSPVSVRNDGDGRLLIHRAAYDRELADGVWPDLTHPFARGLMADTERLLPRLAGTALEGVRYGVRPMPLDAQPIIGADPRADGLYHVVMHGAVRRAAVVARYATRELCGADVPELRPYRPDRPSLHAAAAAAAAT